ncbi:MAG: peptide-methionine (S)-S-oxide reductase [Gaiellales bacterium]|jgi:peptide-methionine (S)-S-oxide reductase|nr:peptide-methionine (S)-S-oxide reductase [Gaiellales bacterium]
MTEKATFAAGCFWGVEHAFMQLEGVESTSVGYTGGHVDHPDYRTVCSGRTGHAEAVEVEFDPERIGYDQLLTVFWNEHDPTQKDRQGVDVGSQYRSAVFVHSPEQREAAERSLAKAQTHLSRPVVTEISDAAPFWPAEEYHQRYLEKNGRAVCRMQPPAPIEEHGEPVEEQGGILRSLLRR